MPKYGWMLNVERCAYLDDPADTSIKHFNVNLVRPWSDDTAAGAQGPEVLDKKVTLGALLYPWKWSSPTWKVFGTHDGATWQALGTGTVLDGVDDLEVMANGSPSEHVRRMRERMSEELDGMTARCTRPFSVDVGHYWGREERTKAVTSRSHSHALAPLTHWPAHASSTVLGLTRFLRLQTADLVGITHIVCMPEIDFERGDPSVQEASGHVTSVVTQAPPPSPEKYQTVAAYDNVDIAFTCLSAAVADPPAPAPLKLSSSQGLLTKSALRSIAVGHMMPLSIMRSWASRVIEKVSGDPKFAQGLPSDDPEVTAALNVLSHPDVQSGMRELLWRAIGVGAESTAKPGVPPNVAEWLLPFKQAALGEPLRNALNTTMLTSAQAEAALDVVLHGNGNGGWAGLAKMEVSQQWSDASSSRWKSFSNARRPTGGPLTLLDSWRDWSLMASTLLSDDGALEMLGPWLSIVHDANFAAGGDLAKVWTDVIRPGLRQSGLRRDHLMRAQGALLSPAQWASFEDSDAEPGVSVDPARLATASVAAITRLVGNACAALVRDAGLGAYGLDPHLNEVIAALQAALDKSGTRARPRAHDRGLRLSFAAAEKGMNADALKAWDNRIRGYAIAVCGGVLKAAGGWEADLGRARWITDTALMVRKDASIHWLELKAGGKAWMHDTVGATSSDGQRTLSIEYDGVPASTALADEVEGTLYASNGDIKDDGFADLDFGWPKTLELPLMAFGTGYYAVATALDNSGGVLDGDCRGAHLAVLKPAQSLDFKGSAAEPFRYLSSEPPGAPRTLVGVDHDCFELTEETQAHAYQGLAGPTAPAMPVALLGHREPPDFLVPSVKSNTRLEWAAPAVHAEFFKRWLQADQLVRQLGADDGLLSDEAFKGLTSSAFVEFMDKLLEIDRATGRVKTMPYNPAVSAIGVQVFDPVANTTERHVIPIVRTRVEAGKLVALNPKVVCKVNAVAESAPMTPSVAAGNTVTVTVRQGRFVRIRAYALVAKPHFEIDKGSLCRFAKGIELSGSDDPGFAGHMAFGPSEHWFEVMPAWRDGRLNERELTLEMEVPRSVEGQEHSPNQALVRARFGTESWVTWIKGILLQRHEWHWTGYPVELPRSDALNAWLASFAGVESFRESMMVTMATSFSPMKKWALGPDGGNAEVVHRWSLAQGARPARYGAYFARPVLRFGKWLSATAGTASSPRVVEQWSYGVGAVVKGRRPLAASDRIAAPALRWSVPLTSSHGWDFEADGNVSKSQMRRRPNGSMLVFDESFRRTDDLAQLGGLGDTVEVDLLETRIQGINEIGANPIFHWKGAEDGLLDIEAGAPFGLTFDIGPNPKVAQTAVVVNPEKASGRWTMARLRTRRLILPEVELGSELKEVTRGGDVATAIAKLSPADQAALAMLDGKVFEIPTRIQGEDVVPLDLAIDLIGLDPTVRPKVSILLGDGEHAKKLDFEIPAYSTAGPLKPAQGDARRLLASWHKGRWKQSEDPSWRCQVLLQRRRQDVLAWDAGSDNHKASCYQAGGSELPRKLGSARAWLFINKPAITVEARRVRMSDYTNPIWMSFIGNFGRESLGFGADYALVRDGALTLALRGRRADTVLPRTAALDLDEPEPTFHLALLFRPLPDVTRSAPEAGTGALVSAYIATGQNQQFLHLRLRDEDSQNAPDLTGCHGYVIALQRATGLATGERQRLTRVLDAGATGWSSFEGLLKLAFPEPKNGGSVEALIRFLPEYLGPVEVKV